MSYHLMKKSLTDLLTNFSVLSSDTVGPSGEDWHSIAIAVAMNLRVLADCVDAARDSSFPVFPSPADVAGINDINEKCAVMPNQLDVTCKTICIDCIHHNEASPKATWYNHCCLCPTVARIKEQDPVTGEEGYCIRNSLDDIIFTEKAHPYCKDINHGNCEHFISNRE